MATNLIARKVKETTAIGLKKRGATRSRGVEAEPREIPRTAVKRPKRNALATLLAEMPNVGLDSDFARAQ